MMSANQMAILDCSKNRKKIGEKEFQDKVVVVAGGESGIGRRCVELFLEAGAQMVVAGIAEEKL